MYKILTASLLALVTSLVMAQGVPQPIFSSNEALENSFLDGKNYVSAGVGISSGKYHNSTMAGSQGGTTSFERFGIGRNFTEKLFGEFAYGQSGATNYTYENSAYSQRYHDYQLSMGYYVFEGMYARFGLDRSFVNSGLTNSTGNGYLFGTGYKYDIAKDFAAVVDYTRFNSVGGNYSSGFNQYTLNGQYKF